MPGKEREIARRSRFVARFERRERAKRNEVVARALRACLPWLRVGREPSLGPPRRFDSSLVAFRRSSLAPSNHLSQSSSSFLFICGIGRGTRPSVEAALLAGRRWSRARGPYRYCRTMSRSLNLPGQSSLRIRTSRTARRTTFRPLSGSTYSRSEVSPSNGADTIGPRRRPVKNASSQTLEQSCRASVAPSWISCNFDPSSLRLVNR